MEISNLLLKKFAVFFLILSSIFFWSLNFGNVEIRFLYLFLIFPIIYKSIKEKNFFQEKIKIITIFSLILISNFLISFDLNNYNILYFINYSVFFCTFLIVLHYSYLIQKIDILVLLILLFFFLTLIISGEILIPSINNSFDPWVDKCGGIKLNLTLLNLNENFTFISKDNFDNVFYEKISSFKLGVKEMIFKENSHFSIVASAVCMYGISKYFDSKNKLFKILLISFLILSYIKSTTTFYLSCLLSFFIIFLFNYKKFSNIKKVAFFIFLTLIVSTLIIDSKCSKKFKPIFNIIKTNLFLFNQSVSDLKNDNFNNKKFNDKNEVKLKIEIEESNTTSAVILKSTEIALKSILEKPFGWGINNYFQAHQKYLDELKFYKSYNNHIHVKTLNKHDASSTLIKMIVELGLFNLIILIFFIKYLKNKSIALNEKLFCVTLIISQLIRGVGYFNSGFLIILFFVILRSNFNKKFINFDKTKQIP